MKRRMSSPLARTPLIRPPFRRCRGNCLTLEILPPLLSTLPKMIVNLTPSLSGSESPRHIVHPEHASTRLRVLKDCRPFTAETSRYANGSRHGNGQGRAGAGGGRQRG